MQFHQESQTREAQKAGPEASQAVEDLLPHAGSPHPCSTPELEGGAGWPLAPGGITGHSSLHCLDLSESCSWPEVLDIEAHLVSYSELTSISAVFVLPVFLPLTGPHSHWLCGIHLNLMLCASWRCWPAAPQCHHTANPAPGWMGTWQKNLISFNPLSTEPAGNQGVSHSLGTTQGNHCLLAESKEICRDSARELAVSS